MLRACLRPWNKLRAFLDTYLDPSEQLTELLVGLIMVLICTVTASWVYLKETAEIERDPKVAEEDDKDPRKDALDYLQYAPGINLTWGLITGLMITMNNLYARSRPFRLQYEVRDCADEAEAVAVVADDLDEDLESITTEEERHALYLQIVRRLGKTDMPGAAPERKDLVAGCIIFCLVMVTALPAYLPYLFGEKDLMLGLRLANGVLVSLLFAVGYCWGCLVRTNALAAAVIILLIGLSMVGVAEVFGG